MHTNAAHALLPNRRWQWTNLLWTQGAWFAVVLSAAHGQPAWGLPAALMVVAWHLRLAPRPQSEAALIALVALLGTAADALVLRQDVVAYASGQWASALAPAWMSTLWAVFGTSLNVTLRWLRGRPWLTILLGAVAGPLAFASGARMGAAELLDPARALWLLSLEWALMLPILVALATRLDGVAPLLVAAAPDSR